MQIRICLSVYSQVWSVDLIGLNQCFTLSAGMIDSSLGLLKSFIAAHMGKTRDGAVLQKLGRRFFPYLPEAQKQRHWYTAEFDLRDYRCVHICYGASHTFIRNNVTVWFVILVWRSWVSYPLLCLWLRRSDWRSWIRPIREPNRETAFCVKRNQHNISNTTASDVNLHSLSNRYCTINKCWIFKNTVSYHPSEIILICRFIINVGNS